LLLLLFFNYLDLANKVHKMTLLTSFDTFPKKKTSFDT